VLISAATVALTYGVTRRVSDVRTARVAAWMIALHPTVAFFASRLWVETLYGATLMGAVWAVLWARDQRRSLLRAAAVGLLVAACAYLRGVGSALAPLFALALLWPDDAGWRAALRGRWAQATTALVTTILLVAPYSWYASRRFGGPILTDATAGQVAYISNNDFPVYTFDLGVGMLNEDVVTELQSLGRPRCPDTLPVGARNQCELDNAKTWVRTHPATFLGRVPVRLAQLFNPNSFLTRTLRLGQWPGVPWWLKEGLCLSVIGASVAVFFGGTVGGAARAKGPVGALTVGLVAYQVAVVSVLFGMTRFRVPLVPLGVVWLAVLVASPRATLHALRGAPARLTIAVVLCLTLIPLVAWHLLAGFPSLYR